jgi:mannose-6-phosphate isomerase-like protein (cupin superfamily)
MRLTPLVVLFSTLAATAGAQSAAPSRVVAITKADIDLVLKHVGPEGGATDRQIRVVDLGKYNVAVGVLHRGATREGAPVAAISHDRVTEVYYILSGGGTLVTGGKIMNGRRSGPESEVTTTLNGPSCSGAIVGSDVVKKVVKTGDIIIIPAGVPHGWTDITDHVDYLSFRPSARVLKAGYVNPAIK